jgi:replication-associated recombination protein RarA
MTDHHIELFSEKMRPQKLQDLTIRQAYIDKLQRMVDEKSVMNMLFYGRAGTGKTSAARILLTAIDADTYELNGSHNHGDKTMVHGIGDFATTVSMEFRPKVVFIDEADGLTKDVQAALRNLIESCSERVRFILTANDPRKLSDAIKSRCNPLCFDPPFGEVGEIVDRLTQRYENAVQQIGVESETQRVRQIVASRFPDMRSIANALEFEYL